MCIRDRCGGSDYTSGLAGNVVVGRFYDWLTDQGGTAIFEEIVEAIGCLLYTSCVSSEYQPGSSEPARFWILPRWAYCPAVITG